MALSAYSPGSSVPSSATVVEAGGSAVSWPAIFAGAAAAAALSLILLILGTGLGLASVSPWSQEGITATTFGVTTILWITFTQLMASGMGGYLAGRLRTRWAGVQADEVYFRDTAHGFLAWAVASLLTAALLTSAVSTIVGGGVKAGATVAAGGAAAAGTVATQVADEATGGDQDLSYFVNSLFRADGTAVAMPDNTSPAAMAAETTGILFNALRKGELPAADASYLSQRVAQRTGISVPEAQKRVTDTFSRVQMQARQAETVAREAADTARKASSKAALWLFVSLLAGAFIASLAATFGGRQRDTD
ncbi:hypothetical protein [Hydrogenophaga palleronii]|uniref:hypothetical protein n=1 Tax=Hydrogenophaga palleronii TaxID=65655 RepID=UPI000A069836|nr:hypothetical protein [Hydrogenophaga palleronii]